MPKSWNLALNQSIWDPRPAAYKPQGGKLQALLGCGSRVLGVLSTAVSKTINTTIVVLGFACKHRVGYFD